MTFLLSLTRNIIEWFAGFFSWNKILNFYPLAS